MNDSLPVFQQIIELIENDIITGVYQTDDLIISTTQIAKIYSVNPTTAVKAISKMADAGIIYKKRGIGMCVAKGAQENIKARRKRIFIHKSINTLMKEATMLGISTDELISIIKEKEGEMNHD
ncbi:MAG: GntR family transcriptional regulator [Lachnospiraceae bacterium]|jgi:DNA-binding transcriptional regulator YhcF (GntR family)|nr:GntR family transcriptional regulator [Lachnospiraceae bacterium]